MRTECDKCGTKLSPIDYFQPEYPVVCPKCGKFFESEDVTEDTTEITEKEASYVVDWQL